MTLRNLSVIYSVLIVISLTALLLGYRFFVELPQERQGISRFQEAELQILQATLNKEIKSLEIINFDYATWKSSYQFVSSPSQSFIDENFSIATFQALNLDAVLFIDRDMKVVWGKGWNDTSTHLIGIADFLDFSDKKNIKALVPLSGSHSKAITNGVRVIIPQKSGFYRSKKGVVIFSSTQVRKIDGSGLPNGSLVFIRKINSQLISTLAETSQLKVSITQLGPGVDVRHIPQLKEGLKGEPLGFSRQRVINDVVENPVLMLDISHIVYRSPEAMDKQFFITLCLFLLIPCGLFYLVNIYLIKPLESGSKVILDMINTNDFKPITSGFALSEFNGFVKNFNRLINTIEEQNRKLEKMTLTDPGTGIANRRAFEDFMSDSWARMQRSQRPVAIALCDIDFFKKYNDHFGHQKGDVVLAKVAQTLKRLTSRAGELAARYGGEEFVIVLPDTNVERVEKFLTLIHRNIRELNISTPSANPFSGVADLLSVSIGVAIWSDFSAIPVLSSSSELFEQADSALYQAKEKGRNQSVIVNCNVNANVFRTHASI
ncbi:MAG: diguanylate cyclase [Spongiibacteraceae bacterium]|nr:diguanylate cyclase [Spongiibacteraceae bacterium]